MSDMKNFTNGRDIQNLKTAASNITHDVADYAGVLSEKAVGTVKKYPLHSALAAAGVGFILGAFIARK